MERKTMEHRVLPWKIARKLAGLSQGVAARRAGVDQSHLSKVERRQGVAGPDFAAALWAVVGPPQAPIAVSEWVRNPAESDIAESWCFDMSEFLDHNDPKWMTYLVQQWFPDRKFLPAFPREDGPGLIWWFAVWAKALDVFLPSILVSELHQAPALEVVRTFRDWVNTVAATAQGRDVSSSADPLTVPTDLWGWLDRDEKAAVVLLVRRLAAGHRPE